MEPKSVADRGHGFGTESPRPLLARVWNGRTGANCVPGSNHPFSPHTFFPRGLYVGLVNENENSPPSTLRITCRLWDVPCLLSWCYDDDIRVGMWWYSCLTNRLSAALLGTAACCCTLDRLFRSSSLLLSPSFSKEEAATPLLKESLSKIPNSNKAGIQHMPAFMIVLLVSFLFVENNEK